MCPSFLAACFCFWDGDGGNGGRPLRRRPRPAPFAPLLRRLGLGAIRDGLATGYGGVRRLLSMTFRPSKTKKIIIIMMMLMAAVVDRQCGSSWSKQSETAMAATITPTQRNCFPQESLSSPFGMGDTDLRITVKITCTICDKSIKTLAYNHIPCIVSYIELLSQAKERWTNHKKHETHEGAIRF